MHNNPTTLLNDELKDALVDPVGWQQFVICQPRRFPYFVERVSPDNHLRTIIGISDGVPTRMSGDFHYSAPKWVEHPSLGSSCAPGQFRVM